MNYDRIIIELLDRVQKLEEQVTALQLQQNMKSVNEEKEACRERITTADIKKHIEALKNEAGENGQEYIILVARDINNMLHLKSKYPMVCNAMRQCMMPRDEIIFSPTSGYSSTLEIKYYIKAKGFNI